MKPFRILSMFVIITLFYNGNSTINAQETCKVMVNSLDSLYKGACRKNLAHGIGEAWGSEHYYGDFRKGYPHGNGTWEYIDGSVYKGDLKKGLRHGQGELKTNIEGVDTLLAGRWEEDIYKGKNETEKPYRIIQRRNVDRYRVYKVSGTQNRVLFKLSNPSSMVPQPMNISVAASSGVEVNYTGSVGYTDFILPFNANIKYTKWNKLGTMTFDVIFELEISEPGDWVVEIY